MSTSDRETVAPVVKTVSGTQIRVDLATGRFFAQVEGKTVYRTKLADLDKLLRAQSAPVQAVAVDNGYSMTFSFVREELVGMLADGRFRRKDRSLTRLYSGVVMHADPAKLAQLKDIQDRAQVLRKEWDAVRQQMRRVGAADFAPQEESDATRR